MKSGPFPLTFTYSVAIYVTPAGQLVSHTYQAPGIHLYNQTSFEAEEGGTRRDEHIEITAPGLLLKTTLDGATVAHYKMFEKLKEKLELAQALA